MFDRHFPAVSRFVRSVAVEKWMALPLVAFVWFALAVAVTLKISGIDP